MSYCFNLERDCPTRFFLLNYNFIINRTTLGPQTNEIKYFRCWLRFPRVTPVFHLKFRKILFFEILRPGESPKNHEWLSLGLILLASDSPGYYTPGRINHIYPGEISKVRIIGIEPKLKNNLLEKNRGRKSRWSVPLTRKKIIHTIEKVILLSSIHKSWTKTC